LAGASSYRKSFRYYSEESLLNSAVFYAALLCCFFGACISIRMELDLAFPLVAWLMAIYFGLSFRYESAVQNPESCIASRFDAGAWLFALVVLGAVVRRLPWLGASAEVAAVNSFARWFV